MDYLPTLGEKCPDLTGNICKYSRNMKHLGVKNAIESHGVKNRKKVTQLNKHK